MKKILFVLVSLVTLFCVSCSDKNSVVDEPETPEILKSDIVGCWKTNINTDFAEKNSSKKWKYDYKLEFYFSADNAVIINLVWNYIDMQSDDYNMHLDGDNIKDGYTYGTYYIIGNKIIMNLDDSEYFPEGATYAIEYKQVNSKSLKIREYLSGYDFDIEFFNEGVLLPNVNTEYFIFNNLNCDKDGYFTFTKF